MLPATRARLERNVEYHEAIVEQYKQLLDKQQEASHEYQHAEPQAQDQQHQQQQKEHMTKEYNTIQQMHRDAAKQLRDLLNSEPTELAIQQAQLERTLVRDRGPVARTLMH